MGCSAAGNAPRRLLLGGEDLTGSVSLSRLLLLGGEGLTGSVRGAPGWAVVTGGTGAIGEAVCRAVRAPPSLAGRRPMCVN